MKRKWLGLALAAAVACAGTAWADILAQDSAANYGEDNPFVEGGNGGWGFNNWEFPDVAPELADSSAGACGNVNSANGLSFRVARDADNEYCHAYRSFNSLNPDDVFSLKFSCAWDGGGRGIDLFAEDGQQIANAVNLGPGNNLTVCGEPASTEYGGGSVYDLVLTQEADGIALSLTRTSPDSEAEPFVYETKISTDKKLSRIGFYAGGWGWSEEDVNNYALFVNDLQIEGIPPTDALSLTPPDGEAWKVLSAEEKLEFTVSRTGTEGALEVALTSSNPEFAAVPASVTIADGETSAKFTVAVALQGPGNDASISASATGVTGADYGLHGPQYRISAVENVEAGVTTNFWVDWDNNGVRDDSKLTLAIEPEGADFEADAPETWTWNNKTDEGGNLVGAWVEAHFTAYESARMVLKFDGVEMWGANVTVAQAGATFSGPTSLRTGKTGTYVLDVTLPGGMTDAFELVAEPDGFVAISPSGLQTLEASGKIEFAVEALAAGDVTLTVKEADDGLGLEIAGSPIALTITAPPSYDDYVAYDEASLYEGTFDFASTGAGKEGFGAWQVVRSGAEYGNVDVGGGDAGMPSILSDDGKALFLYGNGGEDPSYAVVRPFANTLQPGQKASVEFVASEAGGSRVVRFVRIEESGIHNRFEIWNNSGAIGINVDGVETAINWPNGLRRVEASIELAADGSSYTLELLGHNPGSDLLVDDIYQHVVNSDVGYWGGGIQGIYFEGSSTEGDLVFNRLAIEQVKEPVPPAPPAVTMSWAAGVWNPDEVGVPYTFTLEPSEIGAVGPVDLSIEPADGVELSSDQIDLSEGAASFTLTFTGEELPAGTSYTITAKAQAEGVDDASYGLTATAPYSELRTTSGEYTFDYAVGGTIEFQIVGTPSRAGQKVALDSGNEAILVPPSPAEVVVGAIGSDDGKFVYTMVGEAEGEVWVHATKDEAEWGYAGITINGKGGSVPVIDGTTIEVSFADGDGLSGKVDDTLRDQFTNVKAQVLQWNGVDAFDEVEVLENEAKWPDMQFTPSIDNPVIRLIFVK